ncbi:MAG: hypothetical protein A2677_03430 [Candidatus Komeilibacteria bacterium RIFCSPHIGHO2_01_FULL_52_14]|uniref:Uncharacterized protein n=1 Tax=Candidatus Komeilibacteria bacterium RIFCSPHIGHO2_01_FULL_52_14 TaxID=1798549 RepID=A0A1G2BL85_9BACT|nr:MAG: hypothetical protein A2677_03430 [Candidatus Komeilibacteria bacterium RIFCSPHIGHO2_01_FULL_52_14]
MHADIQKGIRFGKQVFITIVSGFLVGMLSVYAATTISNNIVTGGTLDVTGVTTLTTMTSTQATSSTSFWIGSGGTATWLNLAGGDLFVQDDLQLGDRLTVGGTASSTALIVGGTATSTNLTIGERAAANATTTLTLGDLVAEAATCIKMRTTAGEWVYAYATSSSAMTAPGWGLRWTATSCE